MIETCLRFAKKYPSISLLICGILIFVPAIGLGANSKLLVENDLVPNHLWPNLPLIGVVQAILGLTGFALIGMSALVAVRRWTKPNATTPPVSK